MQEKKSQKILLAIVGMPGAGKTEASVYLAKKGFPFVRFGDVTDEGLKKMGLEINPENEKKFREQLRKNLGMQAYAIKSRPKIEEILKNHNVVILDGLYSWEEYILLKKELRDLILITIYAEPKIRYERLSKRIIRPVSLEKARERDVAELEKLNKGGPIAIADYMIENNSESTSDLFQKIDDLLVRLGITND
jgi:dephospho-CoA kinase